MTRSDWIIVWGSFKAWYKDLVKNTGHSPTWRKQQNKIHKLVMKSIGRRVVAPPFVGKRPVGRPRKYPLMPATPPGPGFTSPRLVERSTEALPKIEDRPPGAN